MIAWHRSHEKAERHRTPGRQAALPTWLDAGNAGWQIAACGLDHFAQRHFQDRERFGVHPRFSASLPRSTFGSGNRRPISEAGASAINTFPARAVTGAPEKVPKMKTGYCNPLNAVNSEPIQPPLANAAGPQGSAAFGQQAAMPSTTHTGPSPQRLAFSVGETAALLGVSVKTVRRLINRGLLRASRALRHLLIPKKEIERFLDRTTNT